MNQKLYIRFFLDMIMTVLMIVLMGYTVTGNLWHEILGVGALILILVHTCINARWFVAVFKARNQKLNYKIYLGFSLNILLIITTLLLGISSVIISKDLFSFLGLSDTGIWKYIHKTFAYLELILISMHIGLHWKMIMNSCRKIFHIVEKSAFRTLSLRIIAIILALLGIRASFERDVVGKFIPSDFDEKGENQAEENVQRFELKKNTSNTDNDILIQAKGGGHGGESAQRSFSGTTIEDGETLDDFLGKLICTGCGKQCPLLSPQCGTGSSQATQATSYFTNNGTEGNSTQNSESSNGNQNSQSEHILQFTIDSEKDDSLLKLFGDFIPLMGLYIAGTYYTIEIIDQAKRKKMDINN